MVSATSLSAINLKDLLEEIADLLSINPGDINTSQTNRGWFSDVFSNGREFRSEYKETEVESLSNLYKLIDLELNPDECKYCNNKDYHKMSCTFAKSGYNKVDTTHMKGFSNNE